MPTPNSKRPLSSGVDSSGPERRGYRDGTAAMSLVSGSLAGARQFTRQLRRAFCGGGTLMSGNCRRWSIYRQSASFAKGVPARDGVAPAQDRDAASRGAESTS
jgi:hypothetical protein